MNINPAGSEKNLRLIAQEPFPLQVDRIVNALVGVKRAGCVVCVEAPNFIFVGPHIVAIAGAGCEGKRS